MASITTWTRLEPCSRHPNISKGLQAKIHDPLWLLARQWQLGEFQAEDAGSPVCARIRGEVSKLDRYYAGAIAEGTVSGRPYNNDIPLEMLVEKEPRATGIHPGHLAEASLQFFRLLKQNGLNQYRQRYLDQYPLPELDTAFEDTDSQRYLRMIKGRSFNADALYRDLLSTPNSVNGVTFQDIEGLVFENGIIRKTTRKGWTNGAAFSQNALAAGEDGWFEASTSAPGLSVFFGLSAVNTDNHYNTIDYSAYFYRNSSIYIFERGAAKRQVKHGVTTDDVMRIERQGTVITYYHNGQLVYTSETPSNTALHIDLCFVFEGAELANLNFSKAVFIPTTLLPNIAEGDREKLSAVTYQWVRWYESRYGKPNQDNDAWVPSRMEHSFAVSAPSPDIADAFVANEYHGGDLDWYHFNQSVDLQIERDATPPIKLDSFVKTVIPSPVSFRGMPESRWWTFEDSDINLGNVDAGKKDLGRMLLLNYALAYSDDWFLMPVELNIGSLFNIQSLVVTDTFGVRTLIKPYDQVDFATAESGSETQANAWQLFTYAINNQHQTSPGDRLFLPPTLASSLHSQELEEIHFLRDELANIAWAVEYKVENARGVAFNRHEVEQLKSIPDSSEEGEIPEEAELRYQLMTSVPAHWIPYVPKQQQNGDQSEIIHLEQGRMLSVGQDDDSHPAIGKLLSSDESRLIENEEIQKAGAHLKRAYQFTRWIKGESFLWIGRNKRIGRGEGWSGLRYDAVDLIPDRVFDTIPVSPSLLTLEPSSVRQGETATITITGNYLLDVNGVTVSESGLTVSQVQVIDDTRITFELSVAQDAVLGNKSFQIKTPSDVISTLQYDLSIEVLELPPQPVELPNYLPTGVWRIDGNGYLGELNIASVDNAGKITGSVYGHPIQGFWNEDQQAVTFTRTIAANNPSATQIYTGYLFKTPINPVTGDEVTFTLTGSFEAFAGTGAVAERTLYGWVASIVIQV